MEGLVFLLVIGYLAWLLYQSGKKVGSRKGFGAGRYGSRFRKK